MATITVLNTSADLSSKTIVSAEQPYTITGLHTFDRDPSAPFAVTSGSAVVANLDSDKLDGQDAPVGTIVGTSDAQTLTNKTLTTPTINGAALSGTFSGTPSFSGTPLFSITRASGANATAFTMTDPVTGAQTPGFGDQIRWSSNAGSTMAAVGFEVGGAGTNNESQLAFYTQNAAASLTRQLTIGSTGLVAMVGAGAHTIAASTNAVLGWTITNSSNGTGAASSITLTNDGATSGVLQHASSGYTTTAAYQAATALRGTATNGVHIAAEHASGPIKFYSGGGTLRWGINSAGDLTFGASNHTFQNVGTPGIGSAGTSSIGGIDAAFIIGCSGVFTTPVISFGHTWTTAPVVSITGSVDTDIIINALSTTSITLQRTGLAAFTTPQTIHVTCTGY